VNTFFKKLIKWLVYSIVILVILAATLVSASRMLTPYLNEHRHDFEKWATEQLHAPITIDAVHITWYYYRPVLTFEKVAILNKETQQPDFNIQQIKVNLQILPSLLHWKPIPQYIKLFGASIILREQTAGQMSIEGTGRLAVIDSITGNKVKPNAILSWILSQPHLVLDDINVRYIPLNESEKSITLDQLSLTNSESMHELSGNAVLNQDIPMNIELHLQVIGNVTDLPHVTVHAYFYLEGFSLPQWFKQHEWQHFQLRQGLGSAKVWIDWNQDVLQNVSTELQIYDLEIDSQATQKIINIPRLNGKFGWKRDGIKQLFYGEDILIDFPEHFWPTTGFLVALSPAPNGTLGIQSLRVDYLDLADSLEFAIKCGFIPEKIKQQLNQLGPKGQINSLNVDFTEPMTQLVNNDVLLNHSISFGFSNLSFHVMQPLPSIEHLTGHFDWDGEKGNLKLNSQNTIIDLNTLFAEPLIFDQVKADLNIQRDTTGNWMLKAKDIQINNPDLLIKGNMDLDLLQNASSHIDLLAYFTMPNTTPINKYIPIKVVEPELAHWLQNTFYGGKILNGTAIIKGNITDFPFDHNNGEFNVSADINDLDFEYAPKWPGIKHLNGKLIFSGHSMIADVDSGQMLKIPLHNVHAEIPYIGPDQPQILNIKSVINADLADGLDYVQHSPLQKTLGKNLAALKLTGPMQLNLALSIPLKKPEKTNVLGDMVIPKAELTLPDWNIKLDQLSGAIHFTEDDVKSTGLQAILLGNPILLNIDSIHAEKGPPTVAVTFQSKISKSVLQDWFKLPSTTIFEGSTTYSAQINLTSDESAKPSQLIITSDLSGVSIHLPNIYGKTVTDIRPFQLTIDMGKKDQGVNFKIDYANVLSTAMTFQKEQGALKFYSGELHLGSAETAHFQSIPGLLITGHFDQWDLNTWQGYLANLSLSNKLIQTDITSRSELGILRGIDLSAKQLTLYGLSLHAARIQAMQEKSNWILNLSSAEMTGQLSIPMNKKTIQAKFEHLYLSPIVNVGSSIDPRSLPSIDFVGNDVRYKEIHFGNVTFNSVPTSAGMLIQSLHCSSAVYDLNAKGEWLFQKNKSKTVLQGTLNTKDVGKFLDVWGVRGSNIVESGGSAQFNLNWNGAPYSPELNNVMGDIFLKLTPGRIVDLGNSTDAKMGIGKMLNIFNLSTLPRRLTFNFKDFENGYSFDSMQGHFTLKEGSIYTQDTKFDGSIARIEISGRIGYIAKDYDVNYSVTPYGVTSSLPLVATVVGGPIAGAATWVVDRVVGGAVSNVITHRYTVRGPWSQPVWNEK
jgi:uncharacterized protein (TIGR02099 family)